MVTLKKYVTEAKQVGTIYHVCSLSDLEYLIPKDTLSSSGSYYNKLLKTDKAISFTRDKNFFVDVPNIANAPIHVQLVVDGDKLSENYKVTPYNDFYTRDDSDPNVYVPKSPNKIDPMYLEKEEAVIGPIKKFSKYLKSIKVIVKFLPDKELDDIKYIIEDLIAYTTKNNIPVDLEIKDSSLKGKIKSLNDILSYNPYDLTSITDIEDAIIPLFQKVKDSTSFKRLSDYIHSLLTNGITLTYKSPITNKKSKNADIDLLKDDLESVNYQINQCETYIGSNVLTVAFRLRGYSDYGYMEILL